MKKLALRIFRQTFEERVKGRDIPSLPPVLPDELFKSEVGVYAAAFEELSQKLRGMVGQYLPTRDSLAAEIQAQASLLAEQFSFRKGELSHLRLQLYFAHNPRLLVDIAELDPANGLLVLTDTGKHDVSLPVYKRKQPAERLAEVREQLNINTAIEKMRIYEFRVDTLAEE